LQGTHWTGLETDRKQHFCGVNVTEKYEWEIVQQLIEQAKKEEREKILGVLRRKPDQQIYKVLDEIRSMK